MCGMKSSDNTEITVDGLGRNKISNEVQRCVPIAQNCTSNFRTVPLCQGCQIGFDTCADLTPIAGAAPPPERLSVNHNDAAPTASNLDGGVQTGVACPDHQHIRHVWNLLWFSLVGR
jgi:hypothetical protein